MMTELRQYVDDDYEGYFAEKFWAMIPEVYRHEDGLADPPGALRALVNTWATQAALLRRSQDRTWEDMFIALCSDWAIPYIGDLVGTRLISAFNPRGQRIDVAKTIYYRRRAGTLRVLEELIADITGWEGVVTEGFRSLARTFHHLDDPPAARGRYTQTPPGGIAELRRAESSGLAGSGRSSRPFDEFAHTFDARRERPYGIPRLTFWLYRLGGVRLKSVDPKPHPSPSGTAFTFDPSGRDIPLFARRTRPQRFDAWRTAKDYELPAPIACRLLGDARYLIRLEHADALIAEVGLPAAAANDLRTLAGSLFRRESDMRMRLMMLPNAAALTSAGVYPAILRLAALPDCGKEALLPASITLLLDGDSEPLGSQHISAGDLSAWEAAPLHKRAVIDPERGRLLINAPIPTAISVDYHVGVYMPVGAGGFTRSEIGFETGAAPDVTISGGGAIAGLPDDGLVSIEDSRTYTPVSSISAIETLTIRAADEERPYLRLNSAWTLTSAPPAGDEPDAELTLDGLWIGANGTARSVIIEGDFERVTLRHCTFDPGGMDSDGAEVPPVTLVIRGFVETLIIDHCVMGAIRMDGSGGIETMIIHDSVVQSTRAGVNAINLTNGLVDMARVTVFGRVDVLRLYATDCLIAGVVDVTDTQTGCFRFSAAAPGSRLAHPYEAVTLQPGTRKALFVSDEYGQPGFAMLRQTAPDSVARGGEHGAEMGVFNSVGAPFRIDGLNAKIAEYMPFGLASRLQVMT
ncbi:hypothetical protein FBR02_05810 [Anaerolineae bacterium CFX9]|nr:hypothetical protein [Anaerolineae bacterium CFX9]